ncbi:universal stress protein [Pseudaminobacter sp. NGMCC 1.201702]|uniref:universal stress protein n=1 Tax=Pseudaminobacter sp. NGMCC 1.201702 TaxID=3391825 RepID=UPI0039EEDE31
MATSGERPPTHLLFATDFTARSDRAQHRAIELALRWNASLTAVHAVDEFAVPTDVPARPDVPVAIQRSAGQLREEFAAIEGLRASVVIERGKPDDIVLAVARRERADLITTGIAGNSAAGRSIPGSTVTTLLRRSSVPILVVKKRIEHTAERVVVASDLSDASLPALAIAVKSFPPDQVTLFHAFDPPYQLFADDAGRYSSETATLADEECRRQLGELLGEADAARVRIELRHGDAAQILGDFVAENDIDLVIAGTHGKSGLANVLVGSVAAKILDEVPSDILVVPSKKR